jgi:hypothetical protein
MFSVWQVTKETFSFFYNNFITLLQHLWVIILLNFLMNYGLDLYYGHILSGLENHWMEHSMRSLALLIFSPFYARPIFHMVVRNHFERPNMFGIAWSMSDTRYLCWGGIFFLPVFLMIGLNQLILNAALTIEGMSPQDSLYDPLALGTLILLLILLVVFFVVLFFANRLFLTLLSFYDKQFLPFKDSWALTRKRAIKIFLASTGVFTCLLIIAHQIDNFLLGEVIETISIFLQMIASCVVYKDILKNGREKR